MPRFDGDSNKPTGHTIAATIEIIGASGGLYFPAASCPPSASATSGDAISPTSPGHARDLSPIGHYAAGARCGAVAILILADAAAPLKRRPISDAAACCAIIFIAINSTASAPRRRHASERQPT